MYQPVRTGTVVKVLPERYCAVVRFHDRIDEEISYELQIVALRAGEGFFYWLPQVGEQVLCLFLNESEGFIVGSYYHKQNPPRDNRRKLLHLYAEGDIVIEAKGNVTIKGARIDLNP